jgi:hypothetical protein
MRKILTLLFIINELYSFSQKFDTTEITIVHEFTAIDKYDSVFYCNNVKCSGRKVSFWSNGNCHIKGSFKSGFPYDTLKIFNYTGKLVTWLSIDSITGKVDFFNSSGAVFKSIVDNEMILYDNNGKKTKSIYLYKVPSSYAANHDVTIYDSMENIYSRITDYPINVYFKNKKLLEHLYNACKNDMPVYIIDIIKEDTVFIVGRKYYSDLPLYKNEIIKESILAYLVKRGKIFFLYDVGESKLYRIGRKIYYSA